MPLQAQLKDEELILLRFQAHHQASTEPDLLPETDVSKLGQLLDVFAPKTSPLDAPPKIPTITAAAIHVNEAEPEPYTMYEHYLQLLVAPELARLALQCLLRNVIMLLAVVAVTFLISVVSAMHHIQGTNAGTR